MNLALANGETVVKSWEYGKAKGLFLTKGTYNLYVTNKKIVSTYESKKESYREDFEIGEINGVSVSYKIKRRFFFFKRGQLTVSLYTPAEEHSIIGLSAIRKGGLFSRWGRVRKVKVDVDAAKDIVANLSSLVLNTAV